MAMTELPPFRADHVGSLLRPANLMAAQAAFENGSLSAGPFRQAEDDAVRQVIRFQEEIGLQSITDGEYRRPNWRDGFTRAVDGLATKDSPFEFHNDDGDRRPTNDAPYATQRLRRTRGIATEEFAFLRQHTGRTPKVTIPSPSFMHFFLGPDSYRPAGYSTVEEFMADLSEIYRQEIAALAEMGAMYVQIDEVPLALLCDDHIREQVLARGEDPDALVQNYVNATNDALRDRPSNMRVTLHMCRGNAPTMWLAAGGYEAIAEIVFAETNVDGFFLEFDTPRAGGFAPLAAIPKGKQAMIGLVSTKRRELETADGIKRRLDEAAKFYPLEHMGLCPQCGFASGARAAHLSVDDERAKLSRIVEIADDLWGSA